MPSDKFKKERLAALLSLNKAKILAYAKKYGIKLPQHEESFWVGIHQARTYLAEIPEAERLESLEWLKRNGYQALDLDIFVGHINRELAKVGMPPLSANAEAKVRAGEGI